MEGGWDARGAHLYTPWVASCIVCNDGQLGDVLGLLVEARIQGLAPGRGNAPGAIH